MAKAIKCPQCGAGDPDKVSDTEYRCNYCDSLFYIELTRAQRNEQRNQQRENNAQQQMNASYNHARKTSRMVAMIIIPFLIGVFAFIFYMANKSMQQYNDTMQDVKQEFEKSINTATQQQ